METVKMSKKNDMRSVSMLHKLLNKLIKDPVLFSEVTLLDEFPKTDVILPVERFSPRQIIESTMEEHRHTARNIYENSAELKTIIFEQHNPFSLIIWSSISIFLLL